MPIITDQELQGFNEKTRELNNLSIDYEDLEESYTKTIKRRNLFLVLAILFFIGLVSTFLLKNIKPELFINKHKLQAKGFTLINSKEYQDLKDDLEQSKLAIENANEIAEEDYSEQNNTEQESIDGNTIYAVQIGAFVNNNIEIFSDSFTQFKEFQEDEFYKYSLGAFETLEEAQEFRKKVINIGFNDAFVASYINGERQAIEEAY